MPWRVAFFYALLRGVANSLPLANAFGSRARDDDDLAFNSLHEFLLSTFCQLPRDFRKIFLQ